MLALLPRRLLPRGAEKLPASPPARNGNRPPRGAARLFKRAPPIRVNLITITGCARATSEWVFTVSGFESQRVIIERVCS